jgi:LmbE family N-acetylglucosaminyl deacetylase
LLPVRADTGAAELGLTCVVSPHFDDAVLSCAHLIAGLSSSFVLTVFSGGPEHAGQISAWDRSSGFSTGDDVMAARAAEDVAALSRLGATPRALGFSQYRAAVPLWARTVLWRVIRHIRTNRGRDLLGRDIVERLAGELESMAPQSCVIPLGVSHDDHLLTSSACLEVARRLPEVRWVVYEDMPYALEDATGREAALAAVDSAGFTLEPMTVEIEGDAELKRAAVNAYGSQLRGLGERAELAIAAPERYYLLTRRLATTTTG